MNSNYAIFKKILNLSANTNKRTLLVKYERIIFFGYFFDIIVNINSYIHGKIIL